MVLCRIRRRHLNLEGENVRGWAAAVGVSCGSSNEKWLGMCHRSKMCGVHIIIH